MLLRADMDALPVGRRPACPMRARSRLPDADGNEVPVMHACGHDMHVTCLLGAAQLLAGSTADWQGTWWRCSSRPRRPATAPAAWSMTAWPGSFPAPDVALAQHVLPAPAGLVGTHSGPVLSAADSMRITVHGRGGHGSMPQATVDPVVLAAMIVVRLQTIVSRETPPGETAVLTVGSIQAGTKSNVIPDHAVLAAEHAHLQRADPKDDARRDPPDRHRGVPGIALPSRPGVRTVRPVPAHRQRRSPPPNG